MSFVEVVYAPPLQKLIQINVAYTSGMTVSDVLTQSGLLVSHPEVASLPIGIFATRVALDAVVKPGDRIEIYRPLSSDPKEKRRQRARVK